VYSREKIWSILTFCPGGKKEVGKGEKACVSVSFQSCKKTLFILTWWRKKTSSSIKQGSKRGAEIRELESITITAA